VARSNTARTRPFAKIRAIRVKVFSPSVFAPDHRVCVHPSLKNGFIWLQIGFEMALFGFKWVCFLTPKSQFHIGKIRRFLHF